MLNDVEAKISVRAERLREARENLGWSQRELSRQTGVNEVQIGRYEKGQVDPSSTYLALIANKLNLSTDYLLGRTDDPRGHFGDGQLSEDEQTLVDAFRRGGWRGLLKLVAERLE